MPALANVARRGIEDGAEPARNRRLRSAGEVGRGYWRVVGGGVALAGASELASTSGVGLPRVLRQPRDGLWASGTRPAPRSAPSPRGRGRRWRRGLSGPCLRWPVPAAPAGRRRRCAPLQRTRPTRRLPTPCRRGRRRGRPARRARGAGGRRRRAVPGQAPPAGAAGGGTGSAGNPERSRSRGSRAFRCTARLAFPGRRRGGPG